MHMNILEYTITKDYLLDNSLTIHDSKAPVIVK